MKIFFQSVGVTGLAGLWAMEKFFGKSIEIHKATKKRKNIKASKMVVVAVLGGLCALEWAWQQVFWEIDTKKKMFLILFPYIYRYPRKLMKLHSHYH